MCKLITGHDEDISAINYDAEVWGNDIKAQLRHIIATAQSQLDGLELTNDVFGEPFKNGENKVSHYALDSVIACVNRIKKIQK